MFQDMDGAYIEYRNTKNIFGNIHTSFQEFAACGVIKDYSASFPSEASTGKGVEPLSINNDTQFDAPYMHS